MAPVYIVAGWFMTVAGAYALGRIAWSRAGVRLSREEEAGLSFTIGAGLYSLAVFLLGILHLYHKGVLVGLSVVSLAAAWRLGALRLPTEVLPPLPRWLRWAAGLVGGLFGVLYASNAMAPEISPDGSTYHLGLVAHYYRERGMVPVFTNMYAALSQGLEMLFLSAYSVGRHSAAAMVHATFLFALPWMMWCWARRKGLPVAGAAGAFLVFLSPVVGVDGISAYNDVAAAAVAFAVFVLLDRWDETREAGLLPLIGVLAGFSYGVKYTLALAVPFAMVWVFWRERKWRPVAVIAGCAAVFIAPWIIRNIVWWHNPFAPLFNHWFPNAFIHQWFETEYRAHMEMYELKSRWQIPWAATYSGSGLAGRLGPIFLLAPLALLALRRQEGRRLLLAWLVFTCTYFSNIGTRFLIPGIPFLALAMGMALARWQTAAVAVLAAHAVLSWPNVLAKYGEPYGWQLEKVLWREAMRWKSEEEFLANHIQSYSIARIIDQNVPAGRKVFSMRQIAEAYCSREIVVGFQSAWGEALMHTAHNAIVPERRPEQQIRFTFPARELDRVRVAVSRDASDARWSVTEFRVKHKGMESARSPHWRLRADSTPEQVVFAFDNSPVTRWLADANWKKGMGITVDFGGPQLVDEVVLEMSVDQPWEGLVLEDIPDAKVERISVPAPIGLRRAAMEEWLAAGVQYIAVYFDEEWAEELKAGRDSWGLEEIASRGNVRLYRIVSASEFTAMMEKK